MAERRLRVHAVVRGGWGRGLPGGWRLVEGGSLSAAVRPASEGPADLEEHARRVESLMREVPLVPTPPGFTARDEAAVRRFLERARLPLEEALELCEGCWALRVHLLVGGTDGDPRDRRLEAFRRSLRRRARAVRTLPPAPRARLSLACLVPRPRWIGFVEEVHRRAAGLEGAEADVTGPWAPWDFVRLFPERAGGPGGGRGGGSA